MENCLKSPYSGVKEVKKMLAALGILSIVAPAFELQMDRINLDSALGNKDLVFDSERFALLNENALLPIADPSAPEPKVVKKMNVMITAYSSSIWETDDTPTITAANTCVRDGIIANNYLPFGTKVRIPEIYGDKIFVVEDRMNKKKGNYHVDIWFPSYKEAKQFGAKFAYIEVLDR